MKLILLIIVILITFKQFSQTNANLVTVCMTDPSLNIAQHGLVGGAVEVYVLDTRSPAPFYSQVYLGNFNISDPSNFAIENLYDSKLHNLQSFYYNANGLIKFALKSSNGVGQYFQMYTGNHLDVNTQFCSNTSYSFQRLINFYNQQNLSNVIIELKNNNNTIAISNGGSIDFNSINPGNYNLVINYSATSPQNCIVRYNTSISIIPTPQSSSLNTLPDTVINNNVIPNIQNHFTCSSSSYDMLGNGVSYNGNSYDFDPIISGVGKHYIAIECNNNQTGCKSLGIDTIVVIEDPANDPPVALGMYKSVITPSEINVPFTIADTTNAYIMAYLSHLSLNNYKINVCDGKSYRFFIAGSFNTWNQYPPGDPNRKRYVWLLNNGTSTDTLASNDTAVWVNIPNDSLNNDISITVQQIGSLGIYGNSSIVNLKTNGRIAPQYLSQYCYTDSLIKPLTPSDSTIEYIGYKYSDTIKGDSIIFDFRSNKYENYYHVNKTFTPYKDKIDSILWTSGSTFVLNNSVIQDNVCQCDWVDTITMVHNPIADYVYIGADTMTQNTRVEITNTSIFYDSNSWSTTMDNQIHKTINFEQWSGVYGHHDFYLSLWDTMGCINDTLISSLIFVDNYLDSIRLSSIEENEFIQGYKQYPNPAVNNLNIDFNSTINEDFTIDFISTNGGIIKSTALITSKGFNHFNLDVNTLSSGLYILRFNSSNINAFTQIIKQ